MRLKKYQHQGIERLVRRLYIDGSKGALLADEPGLGKTAQTCRLIQWMNLRRVLVVCPASLQMNWMLEAKKWGVILPVRFIRKKEPKLAGTLDISSYAMLNKISQGYDLVVFDEAHYLKSLKAKRTKRAFKVDCEKRLLLTGTPFINRPRELWSLLLLCEAVPPNLYHDFTKKFCGGRYAWELRYDRRKKEPVRKKVWKDDGATNLGQLFMYLTKKVGMVRRRKEDVLSELPDKIRQTIVVQHKGTGEMVDLDLMERATKFSIGDKPTLGQLELFFEEMAEIRHDTALAKVPFVAQFLKETLGDEKVVVFAHHRDVLEALKVELCDLNPALVYGGLSKDKVQDEVERFNKSESCRVFLGNMQSAGTGLTLTVSHRVVFAELDWAPGVMSQCEDRCHRIGQKDVVLVQHIVFDKSIDARISEVLITKQSHFDKGINGPSPISKEDWARELAKN